MGPVTPLLSMYLKLICIHLVIPSKLKRETERDILKITMVKTYNCCKEVNFPRSKGNGPENWFELKLLLNYSSKLQIKE